MEGSRPGFWPHGVAALFLVGMAGAALAAPAWYRGLVQEDGLVEWSTFGLFLVAGLVRLPVAVRERRPFDLLVALFCLFVAGEEISWGQRVLGFTPPDYFLERNHQQEANLHNFADVFGRPGLTLAALLAAYGLLLPAVAAVRPARVWLDRLRVTVPPAGAHPWFGVAAVLLLAYPFEYTGEWVEALAGALFLATAPGPGPVRMPHWAPWATAATLGAAMTAVTVAGRDPGGRRTACAEAEAEALLRDVVAGEAALPRLAEASYVHKRVFTAAEDGYVTAAGLVAYRAAAPCPREKADRASARRRYAVDPWGLSYWIVSDGRSGSRRVAVYSMGPNRHRDGEPGAGAGDDIAVYVEL
jgi:hypothetical protein